MTEPGHDKLDLERLLDGYLDGTLSVEQRASFERVLAQRPELEQAIRQQRRIDARLRDVLSPPDATRLRAIVTKASSNAAPAQRREAGVHSVGRLWALAASVGLLVGAAWITWLALRPTGSSPYDREWQTMEAAYHAQVKAGLKPDWRCDTDEEFAGWFWGQYRQRLLLAALPAGSEARGISTGTLITPLTTMLLAEVRGEPVVVFIDFAELDTGQSLAPDSGLHLHRRVLGRLILYEVSPFHSPSLLDLLYDPDAGGDR